MRLRRGLSAAIAAVLLTSVLTGSPVAAKVPAAKPATPKTTMPRTVTLITGDRVTWHGKGKITVAPRAGTQFLSYSNKGHHYVIPTDALALLQADRLDRRLFDITALLEARYDKRATLPVLITGSAQARAAAPTGLTVTRSLQAVNGYAAKGTPEQFRGYWKSLTTSRNSNKIWLDGVRKPSLDVTVPQIGAPAAWSAGFDGTGVKVAVLDTGIDAAHPDLAGKITAAQNFAAEEEDELDRVGHGTHVASTIAGSGAASGGKYKGVAPGATLLDGKVCMQFGCAESWIIAGMQWAAESGADVVNMSLGGTDGPEIDPVEQAVNDLTAQHGTLFVIAAGNAGFLGDYSLSSPASADAALAVGAVTKQDELAFFSSKGPRIGDAGLKPEITAPGQGVIAARSKDGFLGVPGESYMTLSGTSMATPHVAGAAAILAQQHPQWTPEQRKATLTGSANPNPTDGPFAQGAGRVDVARAITANVSSSPAALSFGIQTWPHDDDPVMTKAVTYNNTGAADVTLQLALSDTVGGTFSLSATSITVPAGGSASVNLIADTRQGTATGPLGGRLVATADGIRVQTPFGVDREEQKFTLEFVHTDRGGAPAESYLTVVFNLETGRDYLVSDPDGTGEARVPAGTYLMFSWIRHIADGEYRSTTQLMWPKLQVGADQSIQLDARQAGAVNMTIPDSTVTPILISVSGDLSFENGSVSVSIGANTFDEIFTGHLGPKPVEGFTAVAQAIFARVDGETIDPSLIYSLAYSQSGSFYQGFIKHLGKRDLVTIKQDFAKHMTELGMLTRFPRLQGLVWGVSIPLELPAEQTYYVNAEPQWEGEFAEVIIVEGWPEAVSLTVVAPKQYAAGQTYREHFNRGVFGPTLPDSPFQEEWISRAGNEIIVLPSLYGDGAGRAGFSVVDSARTALYRNGTLVGEVSEPFGFFPVPAGNARYRLESTVERGTPARLSTRIHTVWGFNSAEVQDVKRLPVTAIGYSPQLDDQNAAPKRAWMAIPVKAWQQPGSDAKRLKTLKIEVSYDDGATWRSAKVISILGLRFVLVQNPASAGFVSFRAQAEDLAGNTVDQTIIRAYEVK